MMRSPIALLALGAAALVLLVACAPPRFASPPGSIAFRDGWHEGCAEGYAATESPLYATRTDATPSSPEPDYGIGWQEGYNDCAGSMGRIQRSIHVLFAPT